MAITCRIGEYENLNKYKLANGEWAVVTSGDPNTTSGKAVYMCFAYGDIRRMCTIDDIAEVEASLLEGYREEMNASALEGAKGAVVELVGQPLAEIRKLVAEIEAEESKRAAAEQVRVKGEQERTERFASELEEYDARFERYLADLGETVGVELAYVDEAVAIAAIEDMF